MPISTVKSPFHRLVLALICVVAVATVNGCSITSLWQPQDAAVQHLPWQQLHPLLPAGTQQQQFEFSHGGSTYTFQAVTQIDPEQLTMIVLSELGNRICTVTYRDDRFKVTPKHNIFLNLPFASVFAATLLTQLPEQDLRRIAVNSQWRIDAEQSRRQLRYGDEPVATIEYSDKAGAKLALRYRQHQLDYVLLIQSQRL